MRPIFSAVIPAHPTVWAIGLSVALFPISRSAAADTEFTLIHEQRTRSYVVHSPFAMPATVSAKNGLPLVMVLHGGGGNARNAARMSGMDAIADREGFLVVYPNGSGRFRDIFLTWNAGSCCGKALDDRIDDVGFLNKVIDQVARQFPVDSRRIYVTGMSNGAMMAYRLGCETPERLAAIAPVAGTMNVDCKPDQPLSIIAFHGADDQHVRYDGGPPARTIDPHARSDRSQAETMSFWSTFNGCESYQRYPSAGLLTESWRQCRNGTEVVLTTLTGFGHAWPGGDRGSRFGDNPSAPIKASEIMWQFFKRHSR